MSDRLHLSHCLSTCRIIAFCALAIVFFGLTSCNRQNATAPRVSGDERAYLLEHLRSPVMSVAVSPNGTTFAAGCHDGSIRLWELATGEPGPRFDGHVSVVTAVTFTQDGQTLISASHDKTVRLWDVGSGKEKQRFAGHKAAIWSQSLTPAGNLLASTGPYDERGQPLPGDVRLWDLATGQERDLGDLAQKQFGVTSVAITSQGEGIFLASTDSSVTLWDFAEGKPKTAFRGHKDCVWRLALSRDGKLLATGAGPGEVKLWNVATGDELHHIQAAQDPIRSMAFSPDGRILATIGHAHRTICLWDTANGKNLAFLKDEDSHPSCLAFTPDGKTLVCGRAQFDEMNRPLVGDTKIWNLEQVLAPGRAK